MFAGAYWSQRCESRAEVARRVTSFFRALAECSSELSRWYRKGRTKASALSRPLSLDEASVADSLKSSRRDVGGDVIAELGYNLGVWNGKGISVSGTLGSSSLYALNSVVLSEEANEEALRDSSWRLVLSALIESFDPEHAVVASRQSMSRAGTAKPWEVGWLSYQRGGSVIEYPERR